ncbi:MAG: histidinol dehydrogenase [Candidatus Methylacidiphilales bacterium]
MKIISHTQTGYRRRIEELTRQPEPNLNVRQTVRHILSEIKTKGDTALVEISNQLGAEQITRETLELRGKVPRPHADIQRAVSIALRNIESFHRGRLHKTWMGKNAQGARVGERYDPFDRVGIYVPGGTAPLLSTALMTVTLARVAGVREIVVCTPAPVHPMVHYAVKKAGATEFYRVGGAQAIAAMAFGTGSIRKVDKIFGPGNAYVVEAKRQVFGSVSVDLLPGPSEIAVLADQSADPAWVAADLLAQAEHGPGSQIFLVTPDRSFLQSVAEHIQTQLETLERKQYLLETLNLGCHLVHVPSLKAGVELIEWIAPEHASLNCRDASKIARTIRHCGAVFIGNFSPVAVGDYAAGPSHTLPTGGASRSFSGLTVDQFVRRTSVVEYDAKSLAKIRKTVETLASIEAMGAHQHSVAIRFLKKKVQKKVSPSARKNSQSKKKSSKTKPSGKKKS